MTPEERRRRFEEFRRSILERAERQRAEWNAGRVHLGSARELDGAHELGTDKPFAGISDPILRDSYLTAARELLDKNRGNLLQVALPILFLQRHALEVALKDSARVLLRFREAMGRCTMREPKALRREHSLEKMFRIFDRLLGEDERDRETMSLIESLAEQFDHFDRPDLKGEDGRRKYSPSTRARYRDDALPDVLDLEEVQRGLENVFMSLFARPRRKDDLGWITEYEELTHELGVREHLDGEEAA